MHPYYFDPPPEENTGEVSPAVRPAPQEPPGRREGEQQPAAHAGPAVRPTRRKSERGAALVLAALTLVLGGVVLFNPFGTMEALTILIGLSLVYDGISDLVLIHRLSRAFREAERRGDVIETEGWSRDDE